MMNTDSARQQMVEQQVRTWDVFDEDVLATMSAIPRDRFVPPAFAHCAYADAEIPLAHGQCMLRPSIAGRILQAVDLRPADRVLEIGTGTGYLTACIAALSSSVVSIDIFDDFVVAATRRLADENVQNADVSRMDAMVGLPAGAYDVVIITSSMPRLDPRLVEALKPGGRLFVVLGESPVKTATLVTRSEGGATASQDLFETDIPAIVARPAAPAFSF
ncbi:MAG: protein-L-isoaspartate O-methyltransferase [Gammaproteobacteria bacterium]|nr:protein-L-isoaspartate O-methyltransferase [Gammaproteobacteria bacterium]MDH5345509.1 protein-L-isoaspartate O-methyltransferase [Gammaproteobacteria bacterium]